MLASFPSHIACFHTRELVSQLRVDDTRHDANATTSSSSLSQLWREFRDCNHVPTWVNMTLALPYGQADFPELAFRKAVGAAVFGSGPEEDVADLRVEVLLSL